MAGKVKELTGDTFKDGVSSGYTLVDLWAEWCAPCRLIAPVVEKLSEEWEGKLNVAKLDVDAYGNIAAENGVRGIPTLLLFKDGNLIDRHVGAAPKEALEDFLKKHISE